MVLSSSALPLSLGRYAIYGELGSGGMATIHFGRLRGPSGFARPVAIKRLHPHFAGDPAFVDMLTDEARLAGRIAHVNVVPTVDVVSEAGELLLVMEYVHGETLAALLATPALGQVPISIASSLITGVLQGLHAAHEARGDNGELLGIVHRDVSPDNVLVGADGVPRVLDFGVAKARGRLRSTPAGQVKGKLSYMPCEQLFGQVVDRRADVYGAAAVLWEILAGRLLFDGETEAEVIEQVMRAPVAPPSRYHDGVTAGLDAVVLKALSRNPNERHATARELALAIEREVRVAAQSELCDWVQRAAGEELAARAERLRAMVVADEGSALRDLALPGERAPAAVPSQAFAATTPLLSTTLAPSRRSFRWALAGAALLGVGGWLVQQQITERPSAPPSRTHPAVEREAASARVVPAPQAVGSPSAGPLRTPPGVGASPDAGPATDIGGEASGVAPTEPPPRTSRGPRAPSASSARTPLRGEKSPARKTDNADPCSPPYYLDSLGIKHIKRACL